MSINKLSKSKKSSGSDAPIKKDKKSEKKQFSSGGKDRGPKSNLVSVKAKKLNQKKNAF